MKTIGLLGGMSWESTSTYYQLLNEGIKQRLGGLHSARICMHSVDFAEIEKLQHCGDWAAAATILAQAAQGLEAGGADFFLICTNTMHKVAEEVASSVQIPLLHIADATARRLQADRVSKVGLLGTRFTMDQDFYKGRLASMHDIEVLTPAPPAQQTVHQIIYEELCLGTIKEESRMSYLDIIADLKSAGAQGIILGCTEIAMLVKQADTDIALYDTTDIHCQVALDTALAELT